MDAEGLFAAIRGVLGSIEKMTLQAVFLEWMDQPTKDIQTNGDDTE
jgi:hypothetical protein